MDETNTADRQTELRIKYVEVQLEQVLRYFVNGYKFPNSTITSHKAFVDTAQGKVILKLFIEQEKENAV